MVAEGLNTNSDKYMWQKLYLVKTFLDELVARKTLEVSNSLKPIVGQIYLFIYLGFYVTFNTVQVISRQAVGTAEETSTHSSLGFCTVNCRPTASNYQLSHLRPCGDRTPALKWEARMLTLCQHGPNSWAKVLTVYSYRRSSDSSIFSLI